MLPVTVITGFLGSGKTTLINHLVRDPAMANTAVLVNEFGEIGLDHLLVEHVDAATILVGAGCLCCEVRGELVVGIKALQQRVLAGELPAFNHLLIETTGLADPAPVLHTLLSDDSLKQSCRVAGVVTVVDALHGQEHLSRHSEALHQITAADRLVLTKTDLASAQDLQTLQKRLADLNPGARLLAGTIDGADLLMACGERLIPARWLHSAPRQVTATILQTSAPSVWRRQHPWRPTGWSPGSNSVMAQCGDRTAALQGRPGPRRELTRPWLVHGVQHVFHPLERLAALGRRTTAPHGLVLIGHDLAGIHPAARASRPWCARCRH